MADKDTKKWMYIVAKLRRTLGFVPPSLEEADAEMAEAEEFSMSDEEIARIVSRCKERLP